jgi:putative transposase
MAYYAVPMSGSAISAFRHHMIERWHGGFKRSSQHLDQGGCDEHSKATFGSMWAGTIVVTWSTTGCWPRSAATVLGSDRGRYGK